MELEDVGILMRADVREWLTAHQADDPVTLAMSKKNNANLPPVVYSQLKIIQKAETKLPKWVENGCIIPARAYEQSSSERAASLKPWTGNRCLDLSCGLGVDATYFSKHFQHVIALEPNEVLYEAVRFNLKQLKINNLQLLQQTAEAYIQTYEGEPFDLVYVDPDRRDEQGKRQHSPAKGKPDIQSLIPRLKQLTKKLVIKASPMYDIAEADRDFPEATRLIVASVDAEVKELLIEIDFEKQAPLITAIWCDKAEPLRFEFGQHEPALPLLNHIPSEGTYIYEPDPAFYAGRKGVSLMNGYFQNLEATMNDAAGFYFSSKYTKSFPGRVFAIRETLAYKPKTLRKRFRTQPHLITRRYFPFSVNQIRNASGIPDGGSVYLICTMINREKCVFIADRLT